MAATRTKIPVGSAPWFVQERRQADEFVAMETEEFGYSVRNEMEWLNEHMGEIFSHNNLNVADIFKTPGKLRGKTPRTARKRNVLGERAPLTDIFAPNVQSSTTSPAKNNFYNKVAQIQIQQDENQVEDRPQPVPEPVKQAPTRSKQNWDSGYHGITDDEMEAEPVQSQASTFAKDVVEDVIAEQPTAPLISEERRTTNETFVSAREDASRQGSKTFAQDDASSTVPDEEAPQVPAEEPQVEPVVEIIPPTQQEENADEMEVDEAQSPSPAPSPEKPLVRKSSFTFSSLPSREPLAQKKSIGARSSVLQQARSSVFGRFTGGKSLGGQQQTDNGDEDEDMMDTDAPARPMLGREESQTTRNHNHSTTEELRNRINMLGQARDMRTSKSIPNLNASTNKPAYPQIGQAQLDKSEGETARPVTAPAPKQVMPGTLAEDDEDDWIAPIAPTASRPDLTRTQTTESVDKTVLFTSDALAAPTSPTRKASPGRPKLPFGHKKAVSEVITSPSRATMAPSHQKAISVSNPSVPTPTGNESTTPVGSPRRGHLDGAVSATKAKLYSAFRSAKGIFASSAGVSAQAKMEQLSPGPKARQPTVEEGYFAGAEIQYPNLPQSRIASAETGTTTASQEGRRTRSSTEKDQKRKDQEAKQMQKMETELEKIREKERQKAAAHASKLQKSPSKDTLASARSGAPSRTESERPRTAEEHDSADDMPPPPPPKSMLPGPGQAQRLREPRRIAKPTKEVAPKAKPAPVTIRMHVPSQLGHRPAPGPSTAALSQSLQDSLPPPPPPKPTLTSKASTTSLHSSQSQGTLRGGNPSAAAKKALDAAAKKKEADAKAAQRKAERQREIEQRRQAKQDEERRKQEEERRRQEEEKRRVEEERRAEQRRRQAEMQRREEAKRQAERQAAEQRRLEQERLEQQRLEQQRVQQEKMDQQRREQQQRAQADGFAYAYKQEKAQTASNHPRADMGGARPISRMMHHDGRPPVMVNPAKPKRALAEEDDHNQRPPMQRNPASYQQHDAKRRKTIEDEENEPIDQRRSVMAGPPVRQSNMNKAPAKFPHGYNAAPQPGQHAQSMYMKTVNHQHQLMQQKSEMSQFASGHIPGMSAPSKATAANPHKTPLRQMPGHHLNTKSAAKSSPHYPDPEKIALPEIATDSEDEDSDNEFQAPSWTESPALRELLTNQQLVDPMQVFGPIAPLRMEEVFRNKERQKKFRDRTSSANWAGADRLTEEERRKDQEGRERMMKEGGWTFGLGQ